MAKTKQLQIRVSAQEKARIQEHAAHAGMDVSSWILSRVLPPLEERFQTLCRGLDTGLDKRRYALAEMNDFLSRLGPRELGQAVGYPPCVELPSFDANYLAAMVEYASAAAGVPPPSWTRLVKVLERPWFASTLGSLRLLLLTRSPPPFRRRNLFVDSTVGHRV